ncbi:hypothetical protein BD311DRAFT_661932 [Dichomitus squalens]|uniref:DUF6533 domain-containing protein n=1 Tax=Dichomitus squalens TaxID=114155 RepID=A0A4V2K0I4_9APHY|nr:hypothetical protein BD311DRAFT_661932 [Dichomitus squalens]
MDLELQASVVTLAASLWLNRTLTVIAISLLYYDYFLMLDTEIEHFWRRASISPISVLFVFNRYLGLLGPLPILVEYFVILSPSVSDCRELQSYHQCYAIVGQIVVALVLLLRTYALYNRSWQALVGLSALTAVLLVTTLVAEFMKTTTVTSSTGLEVLFDVCDLSLTHEQCVHSRRSVGWMANLCLDTTIFALTLVRTVKMRRSYLHHEPLRTLFRDGEGCTACAAPRGSLTLDLRGGAIYYGVLVAVGVANLVTFVQFDDRNHGVATTLGNALSSTLVSRICLNLWDRRLRVDGGGRGGLLTSHCAPSAGAAASDVIVESMYDP